MAAALSGCSSEASVPAPHAAADKDAEIIFHNETYKCRIIYVNSNTSSLTFTSPQSLSGLSFKRADGTVSVSLENLMCKNEKLLISRNSLFSKITGLFDSVSSDELHFVAQHGENYEFCDESSSLSLLTDKGGDPLRMVTDDLKITFYNR